MADIEIVYRKRACDFREKTLCEQCFTDFAGDIGCRMFYGDETGCCIHAKYEYVYKGWSGKRYEMQEYHNIYYFEEDCMEVVLGNQSYDCVKVTLNGKCIYNNYDDDESKEEA